MKLRLIRGGERGGVRSRRGQQQEGRRRVQIHTPIAVPRKYKVLMTESRSPLSSFYPLLLLHTHPHTHTCTCCFKVPPPPSIFSHEFYHRIVKVARTALRNKVKVSPLFQGVTADSHSRNFPSAPHPSDTFPPFPSSLRPSPPPRSFRYLFSRNYFANESLASVSTRFECGARRNYAH